MAPNCPHQTKPTIIYAHTHPTTYMITWFCTMTRVLAAHAAPLGPGAYVWTMLPEQAKQHHINLVANADGEHVHASAYLSVAPRVTGPVTTEHW
jgi:hypothetical protein